MDDDHGERFIVQPGEMVPADQARAHASVIEIVCDYAMYNADDETRNKWLRELWDLAIATDKSMSALLVSDFLNHAIISEKEYESYLWKHH